jgi:hypothetical protein
MKKSDLHILGSLRGDNTLMSSSRKTSDSLPPNETFTVVGISASPVKLGALEQFFSQMISSSGLAL